MPITLFFAYHLISQRIYLKISQLGIAEGEIDLSLHSTTAGWQINIDSQAIQLNKLFAQLTKFIDIPAMILSLTGRLDLKMRLNGKTDLQQFFLQGQVSEFSFSDESGMYAGEKIAAHLALTATRHDEKLTKPSTAQQTQPADLSTSRFVVQSRLTVNGGEILIDPVYLAIEADKPIKIIADFTWQSPRLIFQRVIYHHVQVGYLTGQAELDTQQGELIKQLRIESVLSPLKPVYHHYLRHFLSSDSLFNNLNLAGMIQAEFTWQADQFHLFLKLNQVQLEHPQHHFGVADLNGVIHWYNEHDNPLLCQLKWSRGYFASKIEFGASQVTASWANNKLELFHDWQLPILDGLLQIEEFSLTDMGSADMQWQLRGQVEPISLSLLTTAFDYPPLRGQFSAIIPQVTYQDEQLVVGGQVLIQLFDGQVIIHTLSLEQPFGKKPQLKATIDIIHIDLQPLTEITRFGEIQGHLSGYVHDLLLVNWYPVAFDAFFTTIKDSFLPRRISQQAINNFSNLGGNAAVNAISRSLLSIFEHFYYDKIGWGCRLQQGICYMRGVASAKSGYYIVKGGGIPRIDVIGYNETVDWEVLLNRLKRITQLQISNSK